MEIVREAHQKLSRKGNVAEDRIQVVKVLEERQRHSADDPDLQRWIDALYEMEYATKSVRRYDLVCYVCGQPPARKECWIRRDAPIDHYSGGRPLEAIEVYLDQVSNLVLEVYGRSQREQTNG